jgi:hypothetical protein
VVVQADYFGQEETSSRDALSANSLPAIVLPANALQAPRESRALVPSTDAGVRRAAGTSYYDPIRLYTRTQRGLERPQALLDVLA